VKCADTRNSNHARNKLKDPSISCTELYFRITSKGVIL